MSRVSSYDFTVSLGLMPIGMAVAGPVADAVGLHETLAAMSALGMLAALLWLAAPGVRSVRRAPPRAQRPAEDVTRPPDTVAAPGIAPAARDGASLTATDERRFSHTASDVRT